VLLIARAFLPASPTWHQRRLECGLPHDHDDHDMRSRSPSFAALGLVPFQIMAHYYTGAQLGKHGETLIDT